MGKRTTVILFDSYLDDCTLISIKYEGSPLSEFILVSGYDKKREDWGYTINRFETYQEAKKGFIKYISNCDKE